MTKRNLRSTALGATVLAVLLLTSPAIAQTVLVDEDWQGNDVPANERLDDTTTFHPGWLFIQGNGNIFRGVDSPANGLPGGAEGAANQALQFEWAGQAAEYDTEHTWSAADEYRLTFNATEMSWGNATDRTVVVEITETARDGGGNLLGTQLLTNSFSLPQYDSAHDDASEDWSAAQTFSWNFSGADFNGGSEGSELTLEVGSADGRGLYIDNIELTLNPTEDTDAPTPNPITFLNPDGFPAALSGSSITMTATGAVDPSGVQYYFTETSGNPGGDNSAWQDEPTYTDTGLNPNTMYTYTVTARDKSLNNNEGAASDPASATTDPPDMVPPTPNPMTFLAPEGFPTALSTSSISMTATTADDPSEVQYYFTETSGNPGGDDSVWQDSPTYTDTGLNAGTQYTYTVTARDKSLAQNEGTASAPASATTKPPGVLVDENWQGNDVPANQRLDDTTTFHPGWLFIQGNGNIFRGVDSPANGLPGGAEGAANQALQFEWAGQAAEYDTSHNWSASDQYTLTFNATEMNWGNATDRTVVIEITETSRDGGGNLNGTQLLTNSFSLPEYDTAHDDAAEDWSAAQTFQWDFSGADFIGGIEGSPVTFEIGSADGRGLYVDNILLALSGPPTDFVITEILYNPDAVPDPTVTLTWSKTRADFYIAKISSDMMDWEADIGDSLSADDDLRPEDPDHITMTLALPPGPQYADRAYFRIEEE